MTTEYRIEYRDADDEPGLWYPYNAPTESPEESFETATTAPEMDYPNNRSIVEWRLVKVTTEVVRTATR